MISYLTQAAERYYDSLPEKAQEFVKGSLYSSAALILGYGTCLLYETGTCRIETYRFIGEIPNCGNEPVLTIATHTVLPGTILNCAKIAHDHFKKALS